MKIYTHKSGKYTATKCVFHKRREDITTYCLRNLSNGSFSYVDKELIENSSDWIEVVEGKLSLYTDKQIEIAFRTFLAGITVHGQPLSYPKVLRFEEIFFQILLEQKKIK